MRQIPEKIDSKFRFVLLAAERAEQLMRGAQTKLEKPEGKPARVGMEEIFEETVEWDYGPPPEVLEAAADEAAEAEAGQDG